MRVVGDGESSFTIYGEILQAYDEDRLRHFRLAECFSVHCPEGEVGDIHVADVTSTLARDQFELARSLDWSVD